MVDTPPLSNANLPLEANKLLAWAVQRSASGRPTLALVGGGVLPIIAAPASVVDSQGDANEADVCKRR